ncbi:unnamed protein product [Closterium sp. NIES-53]
MTERGTGCAERVKASARAKGNAQKEATRGGLVEITVIGKTRVDGGNIDTLELLVREEVVAKGWDVETSDPTGGESGAGEGGEVSAWDGEAGVSTMNLGGKWEGGEGASVFECGFCGPTVKDKVQGGGGRRGEVTRGTGMTRHERPWLLRRRSSAAAATAAEKAAAAAAGRTGAVGAAAAKKAAAAAVEEIAAAAAAGSTAAAAAAAVETAAAGRGERG